MTRISCHQLSPAIARLETNLGAVTTAILDSVRAGSRVVVFPELATSGYMLRSVDEARSVAISAGHPIFAEWAASIAAAAGAAADAVAIVGFAELGHDGLVYNSAAVVGASGVLAVYRKVHLWDKEKLIFTAGDGEPPVVDTPAGKLGILICFDLEFPEMTRSLALRGAELIVVPTNWPVESVPAGERVPEVTVAMAAAYSNRVAVACCDRAGIERGQGWNEASCIIDESGWVIATAGTTGVATADLNLDLSHNKSLGGMVDVFEDRRPDLYGALTTPKR